MNPTDSVRSFDFGVVWRLGWIVLLCIVIGGGAGYVHAHNEHKRYSATAQLLFGNSSVLEALGLTNNAAASSQVGVAQATDQDLVGLPVIGQRTSAALGAGAPAGGFSVRTASSGSSNLVEVTATSQSPGAAALVANTYVSQFLKYSLNRQQSEVQSAISALEQRIAAYRTTASTAGAVANLQKSLNQLETLSASEPLDASIAQRALAPTSPSGPRTLRVTVLGLLIGLVVGFMGVVVVDWFDPRLHAVAGIGAGTLEVLEVDRGSPTTNGFQRAALGLARRMGRSDPVLLHNDTGYANGAFVSGSGGQETLLRSRLAEATASAAAEAGLQAAVLRFDSGSLGVGGAMGGASGDSAPAYGGEQPAPDGSTATAGLDGLAALVEGRTPTAAGGHVDVYAAAASAFVDDAHVVRLLAALRGSHSFVVVDLGSLDESSVDALIGRTTVVVVAARLHRSSQRGLRQRLERVNQVRGEPALLAIARRRLRKGSAQPAGPTKPAS